MKPLARVLLVVATAALPVSAMAQAGTASDHPFLNPLFTDNMVLQRNQSDPVWGWTTPGAAVTVSVAGKSARATAGADGEWTAKLPPLPVGGPYTLTVSGPQTATLNNVLVGDVWVCSGQSNMEFGVGNLTHAAEEIAAADYPQIRLFKVNKKVALAPQDTTSGTSSWEVCTPDNLKADGDWGGFTAVGYFFGRDLYQDLKVPIGLIHTSWGGTPAQAWTSHDALQAKVPDYNARLAAMAQPGAKTDQNSPTVLFNGMVNPLIPYGFKGAIWYQGESNAGQAYQYRTLLPTMIGDWRGRWHEGNFPFLIVQLAGWEPGGESWAELREAQWLTTKTSPNTGIATAIDIGDRTDIHPKNKQEVGRRLALVARAQVYHEKVEAYGPVYKSMKVENGTIRLSFSHLGGGLINKADGALTGFTLAGEDKTFVPADAKIDGNTVVVSSPQVPHPVAVRYDWASYPPCSLFSRDSLPAFPFRTDDWPENTRNNK